MQGFTLPMKICKAIIQLSTVMWCQWAASLLSYKTYTPFRGYLSLLNNKEHADYLVMILGCTLTSLWETLLSLLLVDYMTVWGKGLHHCRCCILNIFISMLAHLPTAYNYLFSYMHLDLSPAVVVSQPHEKGLKADQNSKILQCK